MCVSLSWAALATAQQSPHSARANSPSTQAETRSTQPQTRSTQPLAYDIPPELYQAHPVRRRWGDGPYDIPPESEEEATVWYGWETLVIDGASLMTMLASLALDSQDGAVLYLVGAGGYLLGPPTVHWARGHGLRGLGSLGMRVAGPSLVVAGALNCRIDFDGGSCPGAWMIVLGFAGIPAAIAVDAAVLAYETSDEPGDTEHAPKTMLTPWFDPKLDSLGLAFASELDF